MAKFYGAIGYITTVETTPGVWKEVSEEKNYTGDILKDNRKWQAGGNLNDNLTISNTISIIADQFAYQNFSAFRYVNWLGTKWKIESIDVQRPRMTLYIGGVYNGPSA